MFDPKKDGTTDFTDSKAIIRRPGRFSEEENG
jgi:hypothetical protein